MTIRDWWNARVRASEQKAARASLAAREQIDSNARGVQALTDDELIAQAPARTSFSHPRHEMEMQRRLKDSIEALTKETAKARRWSLGESAVIATLTVVLVGADGRARTDGVAIEVCAG